MSELLTAADIATRYKVKPKQILQWRRDGIIPAAVAIGRIVRFDADEVAKALADRTKKKRRKVATSFNGMVTTY